MLDVLFAIASVLVIGAMAAYMYVAWFRKAPRGGTRAWFEEAPHGHAHGGGHGGCGCGSGGCGCGSGGAAPVPAGSFAQRFPGVRPLEIPISASPPDAAGATPAPERLEAFLAELGRSTLPPRPSARVPPGRR